MEYQRAALGKRIYFQRVAKEMTQEQLAAELGISSAAVSKWERDLARPDFEMLWVASEQTIPPSGNAIKGSTLIPNNGRSASRHTTTTGPAMAAMNEGR